MPRSRYQEVIDFVSALKGPNWFITSVDAYRYKDTGGVHWIVHFKRDPNVYFPGEDDRDCLFVTYNNDGTITSRSVEKQRIYFRIAKGTQKHYVKQGK